MAAMILPKGSILSFNSNDITEHNRGELTVDIERIQNSQRMANGSYRSYVIADKKKWNVSWDMVPNDSTKTVDGKWGGSQLLSFYNSTPGIFVLTIRNGASTETYNAVITEFSYTIVKRGGSTDGWNIDLSMEEA